MEIKNEKDTVDFDKRNYVLCDDCIYHYACDKCMFSTISFSSMVSNCHNIYTCIYRYLDCR